MGWWSKFSAGGGQPGVAQVDDDPRDRGVTQTTFVPPVYAERHIRMTGIGYTTAPWVTHPNDDYVRTPAAPTYDRVWEGFQKDNALALLQYSSRHPGMGPWVPGTDPPASVYERNPMQYGSVKLDRINKVPAGAGAVGPGLDWMPNPSNPTASYAPQDSGGLMSTILRRLFGG